MTVNAVTSGEILLQVNESRWVSGKLIGCALYAPPGLVLVFENCIHGESVRRLYAEFLTPPQHRPGNAVQLQRPAFLLIHQHGGFDGVKAADQLKHFIEIPLRQVHTIGSGSLYGLSHHPVHHLAEFRMMGQASGVQKSERRQRINTVVDHQFTPKLITDVFGYGGWNTRLIKGSLQPLQQSHPWVIRLLLRPAAHHYLGNTFDEHFARLGNMAANTHRKATQDTALSDHF